MEGNNCFFLCYQPNCHKGFTFTTTKCSLQLTQQIKKACFHKLHSWKQMLHTNYVNRENQKQVKLVNIYGINLVHNIFVFEIIHNFSSV